MSDRSLFKSPGKLVAVLIAVGIGAAGVGIFLVLRPSSSSQTSSASSPPPAGQSTAADITAIGHLEPQGEVIKVAAPSTAGTVLPVFGVPRVMRWLVPERAQVKAGQPIAVLDTYDRLLAAAIQSQAKVQEAQTQVAQVQAGAKRSDLAAQRATVAARQATVVRLETEFQNAEAGFQRYQKLRQDSTISEPELAAHRVTLEGTAQQLEQAKRELEQSITALNGIAEIRPTDVQKAQASVNVAMANLQRAKADLESAIVRSPIAGQIIKIHTREGEQVSSNGLAEMGNTKQMYAVAEVYEADIQRVKPGQRAVVSSSVFPGELSGVVEQIGVITHKNDPTNAGTPASNEGRVVEVKIRLDDSRPVTGLTNSQVKVAIKP